MKNIFKKIVTSVLALAFLATPSISLAQEVENTYDDQKSDIVYYIDYQNPDEVVTLTKEEADEIWSSKLRTRAWYSESFSFDGLYVTEPKQYDGHYMALRVWMNSSASTGTGTHIWLLGPGIGNREMTAYPDGREYLIDNVPIQDGSYYYARFLNEALVNVSMQTASWW